MRAFTITVVCSLTVILSLSLPLAGHAQVTIAQISDTHLGEAHAPHAFDNLRRAVDMVNARHPDAVIVSGDVGENYDQWLLARGILKWLQCARAITRRETMMSTPTTSRNIARSLALTTFASRSRASRFW